MCHSTYIASIRRREHVGRVAAKHLPRSFKEDALGSRQNALHREPGVINAVLAADQVRTHQRTIHPGQHVIVHHVDLTKCGSHLADFRHESSRQCREGNVAFLEIDAFLAERHEEIPARVRIDDRLQADLRLMHLQRRERLQGRQRRSVGVAGSSNKIADHADVRVQRLGSGRRPAIIRQRTSGVHDLRLSLNRRRLGGHGRR